MARNVEIRSPYDNSVIDVVPEHAEQDVRDAISRAVEARPVMAKMPAHQRGRILNNTASLVEKYSAELARLMARENGKPLKYASGEVSRAVETFTFGADEARRIHGETVPLDAAKNGVGKIGYYIREPVGVVAAITPFNFPLNLVVHKVAPAVAAGCPIVLKPSPDTPLSAFRLRDIMLEAGLPDGAFEVVNGGPEVGRWLTTDPRVAMITFTGSPAVGRQISEVAGLRRIALELGGNAATIIDEDADIDRALDRVVTGSFAYSGQVCISVQRIYVHENRYNEFRDKFVERTKALAVGDPLDATTDIGPLINETAAERIDAWLQEAVSGGAKVLAGGERDGQMYRPTVLEAVDESMKVMCMEVFGPVVNLVPFKDFEEALEAVDNSEFGLQAGVYTRDLRRAMRAVERLNVGGVMINDVPTFRVDHMPYGGNKHSGVGREGPRFAIDEMTTLKMVVINS